MDIGRVFAVVLIGGSQFKVTAEDLIQFVGHVEADVGERIRLEKVNHRTVMIIMLFSQLSDHRQYSTDADLDSEYFKRKSPVCFLTIHLTFTAGSFEVKGFLTIIKQVFCSDLTFTKV